MKSLLLSLLLCAISSVAEAQDFCSRNRGDVLETFRTRSARIAFRNAGGIGNGGVCWWHSRLQRSSVFLARYNPSKAKPTRARARQIIQELRSMNKVVVIPGYENFHSFSRDHQAEIQKALNDWQIFDGVYNFQWLRGISGRSSLPAKDLETRMDAVYESYQSSPAGMWIMAQMEGITSHSFLVLGMVKVNGGYDLELIDSNHPLETVRVAYQKGDTSLVTDKKSQPFVPYVGFQEDFRKISAGLRGHCREKNLDLLPWEIKDGEIELHLRDELLLK